MTDKKGIDKVLAAQKLYEEIEKIVSSCDFFSSVFFLSTQG